MNYTEEQIKIVESFMRGERIEEKCECEWYHVFGWKRLLTALNDGETLRIAPKPKPLERLPIDTVLIFKNKRHLFKGLSGYDKALVALGSKPDIICNVADLTMYPHQVKIADNDWKRYDASMGVPVPEWVKVEQEVIWFDKHEIKRQINGPAQRRDLEWGRSVIAYRIVEQDIPEE